MSVVGVDLGAQNTVIAVARNRGVDVITNEVSNRATPSMVGFGPKSRCLGEPAKTQEISNLKNTVGMLKRLAGRRFGEPELEIESQFISAELVEARGGEVGARVNYLGQDEVFTGTQLIAMFLSKVKQTASAELKLPVSDVVLSVPPWFTDAQRRSIMDASEIAGLKLLRLMNDTTATALGYGITKTDLPPPEEKPRRVCFVDIGHSNYTASIVAFKKGELTVLSTAYDRHFGGRDFDKALIEHFGIEFKEKNKIDIQANPKAYFRLAAGVEKLKKILSANAQAPLNIESIMNDVDVSSMLKREELEELVKPLLDRATAPLEQALKDAGLNPEDIDAIELVGGCTRVPSLKERISAFFNKPLSFTLNQDEAVARGCAFACAILSPVFKVRDFSVHDIVSYPIEFTWEQSPEIPDEDTSLTVFNKNNAVPSTKILTFYRKEPFDLEARYAEPDKLPGIISPWIGKFSIKGVKPDPKDDFMICKLKARVNLHGVLNVESGYYVEEVEVEEDPMETDEAAADKPKEKVKKQVKKGELPVISVTASLDPEMKSILNERESEMVTQDKLVADTEDRKNALEEYIYETRGKLDDLYAPFATEEEKNKIRNIMDNAEDWLYNEGEDATKSVYIAKIEELRSAVGPIAQRYFDEEEKNKIRNWSSELFYLKGVHQSSISTRVPPPSPCLLDNFTPISNIYSTSARAKMDCKTYQQTSVYINLSSRQELSALCRTCNGDWVRSTIDLNGVLGNSDGIAFPAHSRRPSAASNKTLVNAGTFDWTSMNFGASAKNVELQDGKVLSANLQRKDGTWTDKPVCVNLTEHIQNHNGTLCRGEREESESTISPDVREKLQAVAGLITSQQSAMDNAAFELDYLVTSNQRLVLQELEVAFLRLGKLAGCIRGEFDEEVKDGGVPKSNPDAVLRPMIRSFENVATRTEKALGLVEKIYQLANQHQMSGLPSLQRDVSSLRAEITTEVDGVQTTLSELQEKIKESAAAVEASQALFKEAQATKEKAKSMETLIKLSGWVLLPIGIGMNIATVDGPFWDAVKSNEAKIKELEEDAAKQQAELTTLTQKEADYHATLHAHDHLATQLDTLTVNIVAISSRAESVRETIAATKGLMDALTEMARDLEDKGAMTDYQVSKKEYAAHIVCLLDMALPYFSAVGEVEKILVELEEGDDEKGSVKEDLKNEMAVVRGKLELVRLCV